MWRDSFLLSTKFVLISSCGHSLVTHGLFHFAEDFPPIKYKADPSSAPSREIPPYNGFGSEEDSLCSCLSLIPKPPKRDFIKFMEKDRSVSYAGQEKKNSTCQWASESSVSLTVHLLTLLVLWESCKELKEQVCLYCLSRKMCRGIMS